MSAVIDRDPKVDPQAGDVIIAANGRRRFVQRRDDNDVYYTNKPGGKESKCWMYEWLEWCQRNVE